MSACDLQLGDGIAGLLTLPSGSIDLVLTDPPWGATRAAWDQAPDWRAWWAAINHALAFGGIAVVFASMRLAMEIGPLSPRYVPQFTDGHAPMHQATRRSKSVLYGTETVTTTNAGTTRRYATSVLDVDVVPNDRPVRIHPTQKPVSLLRWLVRAYCRPGQRVADPTAGSGAALVAARAEGCEAIGWELDPEMHRAALAWIEGRDTPLFAGVA